MKNRFVVYALLGLAFVLIVYVAMNYKLTPRQNTHEGRATSQINQRHRQNERHDNQNTRTTDPSGRANRRAPHEREANERSINRNPSEIIYTKHARCRMGCRSIDEGEVREILQNGEINWNKSNDRPGPCPTFALEGRSHDGQNLRIVFAQCNPRELKVVTCIDLGNDWNCDCK